MAPYAYIMAVGPWSRGWCWCRKPVCKIGRPLSRRHRARLLAVYPYCIWCGSPLTFWTATLDHIKPRSKGGSNHCENLTLACRPCNSERGSSMYEVYKMAVALKRITIS